MAATATEPGRRGASSWIIREPTLARLIDHLVGSRMIQELAPRRPGSVAVAAILKDVLFWVLAAN